MATDPKIDLLRQKRDEAKQGGGPARVEAHHHYVWAVLTDYSNLPRFVPGMQTSEIVSKPGEPLLLRQTGQSGFALFNVPVDVTVRIDEVPLEAVRFRAVAGNVSSKFGEWRLEQEGEATLLRYRASITPAFWVPALFAAPVMTRDVARKLTGVATEIQRRAAIATPSAGDTPRAGAAAARPADTVSTNRWSAVHVRI